MEYMCFVSECVCSCGYCGMFFFFQAEDGIRDLVRSRGLGDVYKRQGPVGLAETYSTLTFSALPIALPP